jgi:hypothetical protein
LYFNYWDQISRAAVQFEPSLSSMEDTFAPVAPPKSDLWLQILLDFVGLGAVVVIAPFMAGCKFLFPLFFLGIFANCIFRTVLIDLPFFAGLELSDESVTTAAGAALATLVAVGKDVSQASSKS